MKTKADTAPAPAAQHTPDSEPWAKLPERKFSLQQDEIIAEQKAELKRLASVINKLASERDELLQALRELVRCKCLPSGPQSGNIVTGAERQAACDRARAALAKATA